MILTRLVWVPKGGKRGHPIGLWQIILRSASSVDTASCDPSARGAPIGKVRGASLGVLLERSHLLVSALTSVEASVLIVLEL